MRVLSDFKPPTPSPAMIALTELLFPLYLKLVDHLSYEIVETSGRPIESLKGQPVVLVVNHSDRQDPLVVIALVKHLREAVYCIAAREVFDWRRGFTGWLFQKLGCFSVKRGTTDFKSIHTIEKILMSSGKLLVFPEGEVTCDDRSVHEVSRPLMHVILEAQENIAKDRAGESVWILPVGVSYGLESDLRNSVNTALDAIERQLNYCCDRNMDVAARVRIAVANLLRSLSEHYYLRLPDPRPQHEQVKLLARDICQRVGAYWGIEGGQEQSTEELLHSLRNKITARIDSREAPGRYKQKLRRPKLKICTDLLHDLDRVERLLILERALKQTLSPLHTCRVIDALESEVCGRMRAKGRQRASIFVGKPIEVLPHSVSYKSGKHSAIELLADTVRSELQLALDNAHLNLAIKLPKSAVQQKETESIPVKSE